MSNVAENETQRKSNDGVGRRISLADIYSGNIPYDDGERPADKVARIAGWLRVMVGPGEVVELRLLGRKPFGKVHTGYFDDEHLEEMARAALQLSGPQAGVEGVYFTLNPVMPALLSRCNNRVGEPGECDATGDANIVRRNWLLIDLDPRRPSGISASDEEKKLAWEAAERVRASWMGEVGRPLSLPTPATDITFCIMWTCRRKTAAW